MTASVSQVQLCHCGSVFVKKEDRVHFVEKLISLIFSFKYADTPHVGFCWDTDPRNARGGPASDGVRAPGPRGGGPRACQLLKSEGSREDSELLPLRPSAGEQRWA